MNQITEQVSAILLAVVGVAIISVLVSKNANTSGVLSAGGSAFAQILGAATAPVSGASGISMPYGGYSGSSNFGFGQ